MIRHFCDACGTELNSENSADRVELERPGDHVRAYIQVEISGQKTASTEICRQCFFIDGLTALRLLLDEYARINGRIQLLGSHS